ncbi:MULTISPECIES: GT4 family glycosyltransferase PelF [Pseudoalteromonas]|uniref:GT4 family glycosyltransferase PelF n=1 Tax=Pseudoalteromonas TaxID=53246 RepID=UPI000C33FE91|nr:MULTISPECIES: GT4 family glycosyltransferase PelF [Pseudoalteromonas]PKG64959.1 glycosyl transferase family 1 [Pseudoalteromonas arctica]PKG68885.1 glycosyl transferase family 1 [Pseudoalteromonas sp. GutCa3]
MSNKNADILLLLEGTYPYVRGGVSSWVHQIIEGLPHYNFELVFIGGAPEHYGEIQYTLPENVTKLHVHYLVENDTSEIKAKHGVKYKKELFGFWQQLQNYFRDCNEPIPTELLKFAFETLAKKDGINEADFLYSESSWQVLTNYYSTFCDESSFIDFFWSYRNLYKPLFKIAEIARGLPKVKLIHSISTGYAGILGSGASVISDTPFLLTEHGIYTKERKIDLIQASWIKESEQSLGKNLNTEMGFIRRMWISFFEQIGRTTYQEADKIISLYDGNRQRQIKDGAAPEKAFVVPNGIKTVRFIEAFVQRPKQIPPVVGLIGRVVPIKDIKTFIRAIKEAQSILPEVEGWIIGPFEEDPQYYKECELLVGSLDLQNSVKFLGMQDITKILPKLGVVALTSISEAQPLVLLEAMAAGVPVLASDVGSCREIIEGGTDEDKALGKAGEVVSIASPSETAQQISNMLTNEQAWLEYQKSGLDRVQKFYDESHMFARYDKLYKDTIAWPE